MMQKQHAEDFMSRRFKPILEKGSVNYTFEVIRNVLEVEGVAPTVLRCTSTPLTTAAPPVVPVGSELWALSYELQAIDIVFIQFIRLYNYTFCT